MYQIRIIKFEKRSDEEIKKIEEDRNRYDRGMSCHEEQRYPDYIDKLKYQTAKVLEVDLTEEEFKAIKKGVIEIM